MKSKKNNARIEKWRAMISSGVFSDPLLLRSRIRKGIPPAVRAIAWPQIVNLPAFINQARTSYTYDRLVHAPSSSTYEISLDIPRTFPEEEDSKVLRRSLNNVLKAISIVYPAVGYCQGMNFLTLRVLQVLQDEEAFWLLHFLFATDASLMKNFVDPKRIEQESFVFQQLMRQLLPKVEARFEAQNIHVQVYTVKWFMTLFSSVLPQELFYRIFEVFLNEGWTVIYAVGLTLLRLHEPRILANGFEGNMLVMNSELYQVANIEEFMEEVFRFEVEKAVVEAHTAEYRRQMGEKSQREGESSRNSAIKDRERQNKNPVLPTPQMENKNELRIQAKSEEITFEVFAVFDQVKIRE